MASPKSFTRSSSWATLSPSSDFYYRPSAEILSGTFRIVSILPGQPSDPIHCRLEEVSLKDTSARFIALSYCWNSSRALETIWCDGRPLQITGNLFAALRNARATSSVVNLWIDQICVDQTNIIDRNDQVGKMGAIYRAAGGVIIWLGEESEGTAQAMELPKRVKRFWPSLYDNPTELTDHGKTPPECPRWGEGAWPAFITLLTRPWFKRVWVIQEVVCAKEIVVTCGTATAFWDDFVRLVQAVETMHTSSFGTNSMLGSKTAAQYISFMQELRVITQQGTQQAVRDYASEESMAPYVLTMAKDCEATDHRDKLFAFHHLVRLWNKPDYAMQIEMLYKLFAVQYLQRIAYAISEFSCDEAILFRRQLEFIYSAGLCNQRLELPSWTPDWSVPWQARPLWLGANCYSAGGTEIKEIGPTTELVPDGNPRFCMPLITKLFDKVLAVGNEGLRVSRSGSHELPGLLRAWLFTSKRVLHNNRALKYPYQDENLAFARTITADQDQEGNKLSTDQALQRYQAFLDFLARTDDTQERRERSGYEVHEYDRFYYSIASFLRGRIFFLTEKGYFGLAQDGVALGDTVAIVKGAPVPVLLRSEHVQPREFTMLCEGFVLGIMEGEAWRDETIPQENIVLV